MQSAKIELFSLQSELIKEKGIWFVERGMVAGRMQNLGTYHSCPQGSAA
jgi:hypothetical protein